MILFSVVIFFPWYLLSISFRFCPFCKIDFEIWASNVILGIVVVPGIKDMTMS